MAATPSSPSAPGGSGSTPGCPTIPYPLADVDEWRDLDPDAPDLPARVAAATARLREVLDLAARLGESAERPDDQRRPAARLVPPRRPRAARTGRPVPAAVRRASPAERLDLLAEALDDVEAMLRFRLA